jgi:hypothetical protein
VLEQNPGVKWQDVLGDVAIAADIAGADDAEVESTSTSRGDDELTSLRIGS